MRVEAASQSAVDSVSEQFVKQNALLTQELTELREKYRDSEKAQGQCRPNNEWFPQKRWWLLKGMWRA